MTVAPSEALHEQMDDKYLNATIVCVPPCDVTCYCVVLCPSEFICTADIMCRLSNNMCVCCLSPSVCQAVVAPATVMCCSSPHPLCMLRVWPESMWWRSVPMHCYTVHPIMTKWCVTALVFRSCAVVNNLVRGVLCTDGGWPFPNQK